MKYNKETAIRIYQSLVSAGMTKAGALGMMANIYAESGFVANNAQNSGNKRLGLTDAEYTAEIDSGKRNFIDSIGYGLCQWTSSGRKKGLLDFAKSVNKSIGDESMQLAYLMNELKTGYKKVYNLLTTSKDISECAKYVMTKFERPANQSEANQNVRANYGIQLATDLGIDVNEKEPEISPFTRERIVSVARSFVGLTENDGSHAQVIDIYNNHTPLARGYKVKYTDAWCATFVSACSIVAEYTDIIPTECSCQKMIELFKGIKCWEENDAYTPQPGDIIFYDWQDNGNGDCTGWSDHVGIVEKISSDGYITVIEGNYKNAVGRRIIRVNAKTIRGYGTPWYADVESVNPYAEPTKTLKRTFPMTKGEGVKWLQWELNQQGYDLKIDGAFGNDTLAVVKDYQSKHSLVVDGKVGPATRYSLKND